MKNHENYQDSYYNSDTESNWNNHINRCINSYFNSQMNYIFNYNENESQSSFMIKTSINESEIKNDQKPDISQLWVQCENCFELNYKRFLKSKMNICEHCGYHLKMSSSDRIELSIDPGTWDPMDEEMVLDEARFLDETMLFFRDHIDSKPGRSRLPQEEESSDPDRLSDPEEESYDPDRLSDPGEKYEDQDRLSDPGEESSDPDRLSAPGEEYEDQDRLSDPGEESDEEKDYYPDYISSYQRKTGLTEAVQTGTGRLNGIPVAIGVMDFQFIGGSMGSVVGEKITRLIDYAINQHLPLIIVCASGGARMQEGSFSLMQMAKISSVLYSYKKKKGLFYVSILTSPTTGGVTASFGMLGISLLPSLMPILHLRVKE
uniref:Acetyl-CoA carboxylase carboxyltransferase beta subunit protein n=1 Tax=Gonopterodendron arboreum TaxID=66627 RepID=D3WDB7_GONAR|nr:acetyl-CoA carboxylase carboxyltransferase beta subunit protein [Gonopterodendron arboreum]